MTTIAVTAAPPRPGLVLPELTDSGLLSPAEAASLYAAMTADVCRAVDNSGADLLVNYRADEDLPADHESDETAESELRAVVEPAIESPDEVRFEPQVGSTHAARVGNTVTHLLEAEGVTTAAVVDPATPLLGRDVIDSAAMKLRRSEVVLGPAPGGRVYYAGFRDPIDFTDAWEPPVIQTLASRAAAADLDVDFLPMRSVVADECDLETLLPQMAARATGGRLFVEHTSKCLNDLGLIVENTSDGVAVVRN
jgi:glycosyltransferase A (GT-A) superfamily protein (DUF2064 family)